MADDEKIPGNPKAGSDAPPDKMTMRQWIGNYVGLGYFGNTAVSLATVHFVKKVMPGVYDKMVGHYEKKFIKRQEEKLLEPIKDTLNPEAEAQLREKIRTDAHELAEKTTETRLLVTGGFAMAPFQSAKEIFDYDQNRRKKAAEEGRDEAELGEKPKFSPLGKEAADNLPKWMFGRVAAISAAFGVQNIVDGRFGKKKEAVDTTIAKVLTKAIHRGGYQPQLAAEGNVFGDEAVAQGEQHDGVDPKILKNVRMATSDAYMTAVAITAHNSWNKGWDKAARQPDNKIGQLLTKLSGGGKEHSI